MRDSPWVFPGNQETLPAKGCRGDGSGPVLGASRSLGGATGLAEAPPPTPQATASGVRPEGVRTPQRERRAPGRMRLPDAVCSENEPRRLAAQASRSHSPCGFRVPPPARQAFPAGPRLRRFLSFPPRTPSVRTLAVALRGIPPKQKFLSVPPIPALSPHLQECGLGGGLVPAGRLVPRQGWPHAR